MTLLITATGLVSPIAVLADLLGVPHLSWLSCGTREQLALRDRRRPRRGRASERRCTWASWEVWAQPRCASTHCPGCF